MATQSLIKRNPALTPEQFSEKWEKHAQLIVPFFLFCGVKSYSQVHSITSSPATPIPSDLALSEWDGAAEVELTPTLLAVYSDPKSLPQWVIDYHQEVVLVDEKRFLVSPAIEHTRFVPEGTVVGRKLNFISGGEVATEVAESCWEVWRGFERRGNGSEKQEVRRGL